MDTTPAEAVQVITLPKTGHKTNEVARQPKLGRFSDLRVYQRFQETSGYIRRPGSGRWRMGSGRDDRFVVTSTLRNWLSNAIELRQKLLEVCNVSINQRTFRKGLDEAGLTAYHPAISTKLTTASRQARRQFITDHLNYVYDYWPAVMP
ncbi:hypothetical protein PYW07_007260 [Mythimna separata]|uniref:Transposase Tc1-like domain-containing protein n=1 Tax=Mythimna separata TaxID=271217 RepID=A0AAD8E0F6_MYTSE|nr:hypothetical protein PYW07_007260 [Mythimna separata]